MIWCVALTSVGVETVVLSILFFFLFPFFFFFSLMMMNRSTRGLSVHPTNFSLFVLDVMRPLGQSNFQKFPPFLRLSFAFQ